MANVDNPHGATPIAPVLSMNYYDKRTNAAIYPGDFVLVTALGKVQVGRAGSPLLGVAMDYSAATGTSVLVADDYRQQYYIQADDGGNTVIAQTNVGNNADIVATAGNATLLKSQMELDQSGCVATSAQLKILDFNAEDALSTHVRVRVLINEHFLGSTTGI